jgi:hypothetical protein
LQGPQCGSAGSPWRSGRNRAQRKLLVGRSFIVLVDFPPLCLVPNPDAKGKTKTQLHWGPGENKLQPWWRWRLAWSSRSVRRAREGIDRATVAMACYCQTNPCCRSLLHLIPVRDVISPDGYPDRFPDPRRALIGGACHFVAVGPLV